MCGCDTGPAQNPIRVVSIPTCGGYRSQRDRDRETALASNSPRHFAQESRASQQVLTPRKFAMQNGRLPVHWISIALAPGLQAFDELSVPEKILRLQDLWDVS